MSDDSPQAPPRRSTSDAAGSPAPAPVMTSQPEEQLATATKSKNEAEAKLAAVTKKVAKLEAELQHLQALHQECQQHPVERDFPAVQQQHRLPAAFATDSA